MKRTSINLSVLLVVMVTSLAAPIRAETRLLDILSVNATGAYGLRKLRADYTGYGVELQRASDSATQNVGFDAQGALDATVVDAFTNGTTARIKTWYDQSPNGLHLSQAAAGSQPRFIQEDGRYYSHFFADGDWDQLAGAGYTLAQPFMHAVVFKDLTADYQDFFRDGSGGAVHYNPYGAGHQLYAGNVYASGANPSGLNAYSAVWQSTTSEFRINGGGTLEATNKDVGTAGVSGTLYLSAANPVRGKVGELIFVSGSSVSDRQKIEGDEAWYFGLQGSLPSGHPYKDAPPIVAITGGEPVIENLSPTNVVATSATMKGFLSDTGAAPVTAVALYWGTTDGGTNALLWANTNSFTGGSWSLGDVLTTNITTLLGDRNYYYTFNATNSNGENTATPSMYFITGTLTLETTDSQCGSNALDTATVVVTRPSNCTNEVLKVNYSTSGDAVEGTDYHASPDSGVLQFNKGQTQATITLSPIIPPINDAVQSISIKLEPGNYVTGALHTASCSLEILQPGSFTWTGPDNGNWLDAANWTPAGFANSFIDVCTVNAGGKPKATATSTFYPKLNLDKGASLSIENFNVATATNLHLRGGTLIGSYGDTLAGNITMASNSVLVINGDYGFKLTATLTGSGNLTITNRHLGTAGIRTVSPAYSGVWDLWTDGGVGAIFDSDFSCNPGVGGLKLNPGASGYHITTDTVCPWELDLASTSLRVEGYYRSPTHSGDVTLRSEALLYVGDGYFTTQSATFTGKMTGSGKLRLKSFGTGRVILANTTSDYTGGTEVITNNAQAAAMHALGSGDVRVDVGATLDATVSGVMDPLRAIYLDSNGVSYGVLSMGLSSITTTVAAAYIGGTGGWEAPTGYTSLPQGVYSSASPGMSNYITGSGVLQVLVPPPAGTVIIIQ
jgi:hypothetical protein